MTIEIIYSEPCNPILPTKNQVVVPENTKGRIIKLRDLPENEDALVPGSKDFWSDYGRGSYSIPVQWIRLHQSVMPKHKIGQFPWKVDPEFLDTEVFLVEKYSM